MEFFSGILLGETGGGDSHASLMISALLRTIMITLTMMRMTELRAKPEPKENEQYIEHSLKSLRLQIFLLNTFSAFCTTE
jgi:hypothetical protein